MFSLTLPVSVWSSLSGIIGLQASRAHTPQSSTGSDTDLRAERDVIKDAIWNMPDAFSSEADVQYLMQMYSGNV